MARPRKQAASGSGAESVRSLLGDAVAGAVTRERAAAIVERAFAAEQSVPAVCPSCEHEFAVQVPDFKKQLDTLIQLGQAEGRAAEGGAATVIVERPAR